jgi:septal ring factor EnvC (AmiA/AmiB activator)
MSVVSIRVSEQQKGEIERAALAAKLSIPDYIRQTLAANQNDVLKIQIGALKSEGVEVATEVQKLRDEVAALSEQAGRTTAELCATLQEAQATSEKIRRYLDSDRMWSLGIAGIVGWVLALSAAVLGAYLMR